MKKKIITMILCVVIGGTSIAGVSIYKMSQGTTETQTLVKAPEEIDDVTAKKEEDTFKDIEVRENNLTEKDGQANKDAVDSTVDASERTITGNTANGRQAPSNSDEQTDSYNIVNEDKDIVINGGSNNNNNGGNANEENSNSIVTPPVQENASFNAEIEQLIFNKVNEERAKAGVPALSYNSTMETYARVKSKDMGVRNYFDHVDPDGEMITAQMARDGVSYNAWGENIAYIGGVSDAAALAEQFMTNWMNSDGHRANILSTNFTSIGVGVYKSGNRYYATQEFYK
ncbi:MAG: CAP domain-containing protein [Clostridium sp.]|uniref:CAP domain-containing protein n=1 Tax=Clostridium culturomicium TaxID=1499683 RepID=UPI00058FEE8E|nr:CAP domain-containing protein [Clostridium culturomicium]MDU4889694.1 CAP domain-containing protein [Clostridium sp.]MDU7082662.1 CAP domain-containing protein [Clostridium sp.]